MVQQQNENHHPHFIPNMFEFLSTLEHKRRYLEKFLCFCPYNGNKWSSNILQNILFCPHCDQRKKKINKELCSDLKEKFNHRIKQMPTMIVW